jgi:hypothetical protein
MESLSYYLLNIFADKFTLKHETLSVWQKDFALGLVIELSASLYKSEGEVRFYQVKDVT